MEDAQNHKVAARAKGDHRRQTASLALITGNSCLVTRVILTVGASKGQGRLFVAVARGDE